jgi:hypothetical protein
VRAVLAFFMVGGLARADQVTDRDGAALEVPHPVVDALTRLCRADAAEDASACGPARFQLQTATASGHRTVVVAQGPRSECGTGGCPSHVYVADAKAATLVYEDDNLALSNTIKSGLPCLVHYPVDREAAFRGDVQRESISCWDKGKYRYVGDRCYDDSGPITCP